MLATFRESKRGDANVFILLATTHYASQKNPEYQRKHFHASRYISVIFGGAKLVLTLLCKLSIRPKYALGRSLIVVCLTSLVPTDLAAMLLFYRGV